MKQLIVIGIVAVLLSSGCMGYIANRPDTESILVLRENRTEAQILHGCHEQCDIYEEGWSIAQKDRWHCVPEIVCDDEHIYCDCIMVPVGEYLGDRFGGL